MQTLTVIRQEEMLERFESGTFPGEAFHHSQHVQMAFLYLQRWPLLKAIERFDDALIRFATSVGKREKYHATITWAYMFLVHERMQLSGPQQVWEDFAAANPDLLRSDLAPIIALYGSAIKDSSLARRVFIMPSVSHGK